jgi:hypothetical protein
LRRCPQTYVACPVSLLSVLDGGGGEAEALPGFARAADRRNKKTARRSQGRLDLHMHV